MFVLEFDFFANEMDINTPQVMTLTTDVIVTAISIIMIIVDVRVAYIRKLAILGDRDHIVTANYNTVFCSYL